MRPSPFLTLRHASWFGVAVLLAGALPACTTDPLAPGGAAWTGERTVALADGPSLLVRRDRAAAAPGAPTIVLLSGLDTPLEVWTPVRGALAALAPVVSYDRGGVGRSGGVSGPRPSSVVADELRRLLDAAQIRPPYVLVAHSVAGLHARVFAARYPTRVRGIVLVDATHEALLAALPPEVVEAIAADQTHPGARLEVLSQRRSAEEAAAATLRPMPISVLTSMAPVPGEAPGTREFLASLQAQWLAGATWGEQVRVNAGHMLPLEAPTVVVEATRRVLAQLEAR